MRDSWAWFRRMSGSRFVSCGSSILLTPQRLNPIRGVIALRTDGHTFADCSKLLTLYAAGPAHSAGVGWRCAELNLSFRANTFLKNAAAQGVVPKPRRPYELRPLGVVPAGAKLKHQGATRPAADPLVDVPCRDHGVAAGCRRQWPGAGWHRRCVLRLSTLCRLKRLISAENVMVSVAFQSAHSTASRPTSQ